VCVRACVCVFVMLTLAPPARMTFLSALPSVVAILKMKTACVFVCVCVCVS
jgi:hypothetical protein